MKNYHKLLLFLGVAILIFVSFVFGYVTKEIRMREYFAEPQEVDFSLLWEAYNSIKKNYINADDIDYQRLVHGSISGIIRSLGDPHSVFFNPEDTKRFLEDADGEFEGVGMEVGIRDDKFQVIAPLKGTPADRAGLKTGDLILEIDGKSTANLSVEECVRLIRGPKGTEVTLTILREGWSDSEKITIERDVIELPSLEWEIIENNLAHVEFYHFHKNAEKDFSEMALSILNSPAEGIILDLRNNTGGYLGVSKNIAGWFFEKGDLFVIQDFGEHQEKIYTKGTGRLLKYPIVVIINQGSASASEILAGALRDHKNSPLVGKRSFGKGSIQRLNYLSDGSSIKITVAKWLTPDGTPISEEGLDPDFEVDLDKDDEVDYQLNKAVELLKEMI